MSHLLIRYLPFFFEMSKIFHMSMSISLFMGFKASMLIMVAPTAMQHGASGGARNPGMRLIRHLPFCFAMIIICPMSLSLTDFEMLAPCSFAAWLQVSWLLRGPSPLQAQSWYAFQHSRIYDSRLPSNVMCICRNLISIMAASRLMDFDYKQELVYNDYQHILVFLLSVLSLGMGIECS